MSVSHEHAILSEQRGYHLTPMMMVLAQKEIIIMLTVVTAVTSQVLAVWRQREESCCEAETSHPGLEQYTGFGSSGQ